MSDFEKHIRFAEFCLDPATGELTRNGVPVPLQRKSFLILKTLAERPGALVTRDELRAILWPGDVVVEFDNNMNAAVTRLRRVLGDSAETPRFIETLPGRGYRFLGGRGDELAALNPEPPTQRPRRRSWRTATVLTLATLGSIALLQATLGMWRGPEAPQVAVFAFENVSGDPSQNHVGQALTEQLRARLGLADNAIGVVVPASNGRDERPPDVDFILRGSTNVTADGLHVTALLLDAETNRRIWGAVYSCPRRDLAAIERQLADKISGLVSQRFEGD